jgi:transposase-like protein
MKDNLQTIAGFMARFGTEEACRAEFERIRFRDGDYCPHCGHTVIYRFNDGKRYRCAGCRKDFTIKTGTVFGESKVSLRKWFLAIYLLTTCRKGISSVQLAKQVGVTQKTAWFMDHRIRESMQQNGGQLFGTVEADETFIGGKAGAMHESKRREKITGRGGVDKTTVFGLAQRKGDYRATIVPNTTTRTLEGQVLANVKSGATVYTDEHAGYRRLANLTFTHETVNHAAGEYVRDGLIHTNGIESFWATFKRGYIGIYHWMSEKHLQRYLDEFTFRLNTQDGFFTQTFAEALGQVSNTDWLPYKELIA